MISVTEVLKSIQLPAYEYYANPVELTEETCVHERDRFVREVTRFAGLHSIYIANYQVYPGITKLDLVYILLEQHDPKAIESGLIATTRKLLSDSALFQFPKVYTEIMFRDIYQLSPPLALQRLYGQEIRFNLLPGEERSFTWCSYLNDRLMVSPLNYFIPELVEGKFAVAETLIQLEATRDIIIHFTQATKKKNQTWDKFNAELTELLQNWFKSGLERYQRLKEMVRQATIILFDVIEAFCRHLTKEKLVFSQDKSKIMVPENASKQLTVQPESGYAASFFTENIKSIFLDRWESGPAFQKMIETYRKTNQFYIYLPKELAVQLEQYAHGIDYHTKQVQNALVIKEWLGGLAFPNVIDARNRLISKQQEFIARFKSIPAPSDLFQYPVDKPQKWDRFAPFLGDKLVRQRRIKRELERKQWQEKICSELVGVSG
ncbi:MAG: hypothetical protein ACE14V_11860 [bacterium]